MYVCIVPHGHTLSCMYVSMYASPGDSTSMYRYPSMYISIAMFRLDVLVHTMFRQDMYMYHEPTEVSARSIWIPFVHTHLPPGYSSTPVLLVQWYSSNWLVCSQVTDLDTRPHQFPTTGIGSSISYAVFVWSSFSWLKLFAHGKPHSLGT